MIFRNNSNFNKSKRFYFFKEAEEDDTKEDTSSTDDSTSSDSTSDDTSTKEDDTSEDMGTDESSDDEDLDSGDTDSEESGDGESDGSEEDEGSEEEGSDGDDSYGSDDNSSDESKSEDEIKQLEDELLSSLTDDQIKIKVSEQKHRYDDMFNGIDAILEKINNIQVPYNINKELKTISIKLDKFHDMLVEYITKTYNTKSYIENEINFRKFLNILSGIDEILKDIIKNDIK